ncbi:MAG TPA: hypothetical protein VKL21_07950 [Candidatus Methanoperedens sp.]|nr:hypothetical protein [Candidatus Methanoperedens sp.]
MNTTTMLYVGIDVSKDKSDICLVMLYETIESIKRRTPGKSDVVFGMEATGVDQKFPAKKQRKYTFMQEIY